MFLWLITLALLTTLHTKGCQAASCLPNQFQCATGRCISAAWECDGDNDCPDSSDETGCTGRRRCTSSQFTCANGNCIHGSWRCDGDNDCGDRSDESNCPVKNCTQYEFRCADGSCIRASWRCDADNDCSDKSDEIGCGVITCAPNEFRCTAGGCIAGSWECDGDRDCSDGSDEKTCPTVTSCTAGQFWCATQKCISSSWKCDGDNDCGDNSDEQGCSTQSPQCGQNEFQCVGTGFCISTAWRCDGDDDCGNLSDEKNCSCASNEFRCTNKKCISNLNHCDGTDNCGDGSDELNCPTRIPVTVPCNHREFRCNDGQCIDDQKVCDMNMDCSDKSDEAPIRTCLPSGVTKDECQQNKGGCQHKCVDTKHSFHCTCHAGYQLNADHLTCSDIDECTRSSPCVQLCKNTVGSFQCSCEKGYKQDGVRGCVADDNTGFLLFANRLDIRRYNLDHSEFVSIAPNLANAIALDFHYAKGIFFWTDVTLDVIMRANINGSGSVVIVSQGLESPGGIAVDWIHDRLYWSDSGNQRIEVSDLDGENRKVIVLEQIDKPRAIVLDPCTGWMYWSDWGASPRIQRAYMDGRKQQVLVNSSIYWPNGLTIDYITNRLFWVDAKFHTLESISVDGSNRRAIIPSGLSHPFAITMFENRLYWTDWHSKSINSSDLDGQNLRTVKENLYFPMDIHVHHHLRQKTCPNRCAGNKCVDLCLPYPDDSTGGTYSCACKTGYKLLSDKTSCSDFYDSFLLFARRSDIRTISYDTNIQADVILPLQGVRSAVAIDFEPTSNQIFWTDVTLDTISKASVNGKGQQLMISNSLDSPAGLAVDWITGKVYWTDAGTDRIEVSNIDGTYRTVVIWEHLDRPRDVITDSLDGYLYWTDWGTNAKISRSHLDGTNQEILINSSLVWPNGLTIDSSKPKKRLYWADAGKKWIESAFVDGNDRRKLLSFQLPHPFGITLHGQMLYWTDWQTKSIQKAKVDGTGHTTVRDNLDNLMDIHFYDRQQLASEKKSASNPCKKNNGGCSHLCVLKPGNQRSCLCSTGLKKTSATACAPRMVKFLVFAMRETIRRISLDVPYYADIVLPITGLQNAVALDVDPKTGSVYWTDGQRDTISKALVDGTNQADVITTGVATPDGVAIDYASKLIYWTDTGTNRIEVASLDGVHRRVLFWTGLDNPRAIALDTVAGYVYWTDWGTDPKIERASMDGLDSSREKIVSSNLGWPNGLVVDHAEDRLYWADAKTEMIEYVRLDGSGRKKLLMNIPHPYGLTVLGDKLYWTDWQERSIQMVSKLDGSNKMTVRGNLPGLMDIHAVDLSATTASSPCARMSCSHLCLPQTTATGVVGVCKCPTGIVAVGNTCPQYPNKFLIFCARTSVRRISLEAPDHSDVVLVQYLRNAISVDFHWHSKRMYWSDVASDVIMSANFDGSNQQDVIKGNISTPDGIAVDWIAGNIYWTDTGTDKIEVARLNGIHRKVIVSQNLDEPRAICLFPRKGLMYWSDWGRHPKIEMAGMDGSYRQTIITSGLGWPNSLAIDYNTRRLFWADAKLNVIESSDLLGNNRLTLVDSTPHPFGLTTHNSYIYWTDWQTRSVSRASSVDGSNEKVLQDNIQGLMGIRVATKDLQAGSNACGSKNGGCSHLCLVRPSDPSKLTKSTPVAVCECPDIKDTNCVAAGRVITAAPQPSTHPPATPAASTRHSTRKPPAVSVSTVNVKPGDTSKPKTPASSTIANPPVTIKFITEAPQTQEPGKTQEPIRTTTEPGIVIIPKAQSGSGIGTGGIVGIVVGFLVIILILVIIVVAVTWYKNRFAGGYDVSEHAGFRNPNFASQDGSSGTPNNAKAQVLQGTMDVSNPTYGIPTKSAIHIEKSKVKYENTKHPTETAL